METTAVAFYCKDQWLSTTVTQQTYMYTDNHNVKRHSNSSFIHKSALLESGSIEEGKFSQSLYVYSDQIFKNSSCQHRGNVNCQTYRLHELNVHKHNTLDVYSTVYSRAL